MRRVVLIVLAVGCGRIDFELELEIDATSGATACAQFGPWSMPQPLATLESPMQDWGGAISPDGLTLYFDSDRSGTSRIYQASRPDRGSVFAAPTLIAELDTTGALANPTVTRDELEIYFDQGMTGSWCPYVATRSSKTSPWNAAAPAFTCAQNVRGADITPDGLTLYYGLDDITELAVTTRTDRSVPFAMSTASLMAGAWPAVTSDGLTIYTDSGAHITAATRADLMSPFGPSAEVPGIAGPDGQDGDASITEDGLELYFTSNRSGGIGGYDLYVATRTCP